jgi:TatD DNase family protein
MKLVDTHCHIDLFPNYRELIQAVEKAQVYTIAVTNAPSVFRQSSGIAINSKYIRTAIGFHPELVLQRRAEINSFLQMLPETRFVGEIGLDYVTNDTENRLFQRRIFEQILVRCRELRNKILTVHSRRAANDVIEMIGDNFPGTVILHWFSGSKKVLEKGLSFGFYYSVNPAMFRSTSGLNIIRAIPPNRLLTESDGPFVTLDGKAATPLDMGNVLRQLSEVKQTSLEETAEHIFENFLHILKQPEDSLIY